MTGDRFGCLLGGPQVDEDVAAAIGGTYRLLADAVAAYHGSDDAALAHAIGRVAGHPARARAACGLLVGLLCTLPGLDEAALRRYAERAVRGRRWNRDQGGAAPASGHINEK